MGTSAMFANRADAGRRLARRLAHLRGSDPLVVGLPRGGMPVAFEVARALHAPLDVLVVRKLGVPYRPELAMGAVGEDGVTVVSPGVLRAARVRPEELDSVRRTATGELRRLVRELRGGRPRIPLAGRTVVVVDDGIATGATVRAACRVARGQGAARLVLAAPVGSPVTVAALGDVVDEAVCLYCPYVFGAVGEWYVDFPPITGEEVAALLRRAATGNESVAA